MIPYGTVVLLMILAAMLAASIASQRTKRKRDAYWLPILRDVKWDPEGTYFLPAAVYDDDRYRPTGWVGYIHGMRFVEEDPDEL